MKFNNKKISLSSYLKDKDDFYKRNFEKVFIKYFSLTSSKYYKEFSHFELSKKELEKIDKIIEYETKNKDATFLYGFKWFYDEKFIIKKKFLSLK